MMHLRHTALEAAGRPCVHDSGMALQVLSMGLLMTAYLNAEGMTEAELSVYRGAGAVSGVAATFAFPCLQKRAGEDVHLSSKQGYACLCVVGPTDHAHYYCSSLFTVAESLLGCNVQAVSGHILVFTMCQRKFASSHHLLHQTNSPAKS